MKTFNEFLEQRLPHGVTTSHAIQQIINSINDEIDKKKAELDVLQAKQQRILKGMGVNPRYASFSRINPPTGYQVSTGSKINDRTFRLGDAESDIYNYFDGDQRLYGIARRLKNADVGSYPLPSWVTPEQGKAIHDFLVMSNDSDNSGYDSVSHTYHVAEPED